MSILIIDPTKVYQINGQAYALQSTGAVITTGLNQSLLAGVAGKRHRVLGFTGQGGSTAGDSGVSFRDGSGGVYKSYFYFPARTTGPVLFPIVDSGYWETTTGNGIFVDVDTNTAIVNLFYITYVV
jgi:hypothetical protein